MSKAVNAKNPGAGEKYFNLADFHWLVSLVRRLRPDLCKLFKTSDEINLEFARWLITSGIREYASLLDKGNLRQVLGKFIKFFGMTALEAIVYNDRADIKKAFPLPDGLVKYRLWFYTHGVDQYGLFPLLDENARQKYLAAHPDKKMEQPEKDKVESPPFGVNLVGHAYGQLGIGEDLRMTARALKLAGIPFTVIDFPPGPEVPQNDRSMEKYAGTEAIYSINLFCMAARETMLFYAEKGQSFFDGRYNIGYWPWELANWPEEWLDATRIVDEVWVSTRHIYDALAPVSPVPVLIMPLAVETAGIAPKNRASFSLPADAYLFCFSFDLNSSIYRKNPQACLKAFQKAFPVGDATERPVGLVIKCHRPAVQNADWEALKNAAQADSRIHIIEETLPRDALLALYKNCDCFLSLHRAEGFGRGIAEAILLGLDVIATGYSGNLDYCRDTPGVKLVRHTLVPVKKGQYPHGAGQVWAEADINHAADIMRQCIAGKSGGRQTPDFCFTLQNASKNYQRRLRHIQAMLESDKNAEKFMPGETPAAASGQSAGKITPANEQDYMPARACIDYAVRWPDSQFGWPVLFAGWAAMPDGYDLGAGTPDGSFIGQVSPCSFTRTDIDASYDIYINKSGNSHGFVAVLDNLPANAGTLALFAGHDRQWTLTVKKEISNLYGFRDWLRALFDIPIGSTELAQVYEKIYLPLLQPVTRARSAAIAAAVHEQGNFGKVRPDPLVSVVIPLYGNVEMLEAQIKCLAADPACHSSAEIIYVVDDPSIFDAFRRSAAAFSEKYGLPMRWVRWSGSQGFSGACNLGAAFAKGQTLVFMNSDVFPVKTGWIGKFDTFLRENPDVGIAGCRLLYPDGTIQHCGTAMTYDDAMRIWLCVHPHEKEKLPECQTEEIVPAVTGACIAMRSKDFRAAGGFCTDYLIGGYEDIDLCLNFGTKGLKSACLNNICMTHIGHQTFAAMDANEWMRRLAVYNAVVFTTRWGNLLREKANAGQ